MPLIVFPVRVRSNRPFDPGFMAERAMKFMPILSGCIVSELFEMAAFPIAPSLTINSIPVPSPVFVNVFPLMVAFRLEVSDASRSIAPKQLPGVAQPVMLLFWMVIFPTPAPDVTNETACGS